MLSSPMSHFLGLKLGLLQLASGCFYDGPLSCCQVHWYRKLRCTSRFMLGVWLLQPKTMSARWLQPDMLVSTTDYCILVTASTKTVFTVESLPRSRAQQTEDVFELGTTAFCLRETLRRYGKNYGGTAETMTAILGFAIRLGGRRVSDSKPDRHTQLVGSYISPPKQ